MIQNAITTFNNLVTNLPPGTAEAAMTALVVSPTLQLIKTFWERKDNRDFKAWASWLFISIVSLVTMVGAYLHGYDGSNVTIIWTKTAMAAFMTQPIYFLLLKPLTFGLTKIFGDVSKRETDIKSAIEPPEGLPVVGTEPVVRDLL